ncbi:MAG: DUF3887 domain-containing protein [Actinomycetota bacterium]
MAAGLVLAPGCGGESTEESPTVERARTVVRHMADGTYAKVLQMFAPTLIDVLSEKQLKEDWENFVQLKGAYRAQGEAAEVIERGELKVVDIELEMAKDTGFFRVSFDADGKIAGLFFLATDIPVP